MANAALHYSDPNVEVTRLVVGPLHNNVFIVTCSRTRESVLIDAAAEPGRLVDVASLLGVKLVLTTHGHHDHIGAVPQMRSAGILVGITTQDSHAVAEFDFELHDNANVEFGGQRIRCIATPGHTAGSMCFAVDGTLLLFSGDTLFPGGPGATKSPDSDFGAIIRSIERLYAEFPDETMVLPGHGSDTTIGAERPQLDEWRKRGW